MLPLGCTDEPGDARSTLLSSVDVECGELRYENDGCPDGTEVAHACFASALITERIVRASPYRDHVRVIDVRGFRPKVSVSLIRGEVLPAFDQALDAMAETVKGVLAGTQSRTRRMAQAG